jgi:hypothetical protein
MKKFLPLLGLMLCLLLSACSSDRKKDEGSSSSPGQEAAAFAPTPAPLPDPEFEIVQSRAWYFEEQKTLYGTVQIKNTGSTPIIFPSARFEFQAGESSFSQSFEPLLYTLDVLFPGKTMEICSFLPVESDIPADTQPALSAELTAQSISESSASQSNVTLENLYLTQNYPSFATLSGTLNNAGQVDYSLFLAYVSFYDAQDQLLATWHFTENLSLPAEESRTFVVHLKSLPLKDLCSQAARIEGRVIGVQ